MSFNALFCEADPPITTSKGLAGAFTAKDMTKARWPCLTNNGSARMCSKMTKMQGYSPENNKEFAPENWWLDNDIFMDWNVPFSWDMLICGGVLLLKFHPEQIIGKCWMNNSDK